MKERTESTQKQPIVRINERLRETLEVIRAEVYRTTGGKLGMCDLIQRLVDQDVYLVSLYNKAKKGDLR